jgi:hypothetical protein
MSLLETLSLGLGAAVAKSIAKIWLKDMPLAADATEAAIDAVKSRYEDYATTRGTRRLLEDLQFDVAKRLDSVIAAEFSHLAPNDARAAILAVGEVLSQMSLVDSLAIANLDATQLHRLAAPHAAAVFGSLGGESERLAELLLRESCAYVVATASKLPSFQVAATRELLKRSDEVLAELRRVLDSVDAVRQAAKPETRLAQEGFETNYRRTLLLKLDRMQLFGVRLAGGGARDWALSVAYVTLTSRKRRAEHASSVDLCLAGERALVIRGEAGSGKTTLLNWIAVRASGRDFPDSLTAWRELLPIYVRLRDYAEMGKDLPKPDALLLSSVPNLEGVVPPGWSFRALQKGALLLLDGFDELPQQRRSAFLEWLRGYKQEFPKCVFVLSSRPSALQSDVRGASVSDHLDHLGFEQCVLEPMSPSHIAALVGQWHDAVARDVVDPAEREKLGSYATSLQRTLRERPAVRALASNPLLCAMICALNWDQKQQLPDDRMELYRLAIHMLLDARDAERNVVSPELAGIRSGPRLTLIEALAYWLLRNGYSDAGFDECAMQLVEILHRLGVKHPPEAVLRALLERSGVLREPSHGRVDFIHRTFLEFLAARCAVDKGDFGVLAGKSREEGWREVVVFAVGHARGEARDRLVEQVIGRQWLRGTARSIAADVTAVCCMETVGTGLDAKLQRRLLERAESLFPPKDAEMARLLAPAAALRPEWLAAGAAASPEVAAACIQCAALVGGPRMFEVIVQCAKVPGDAVSAELLLAWSAFDEESYLTRVCLPRKWESLGTNSWNLAYDEDVLRFFYFAAANGLRYGSTDFKSAADTFLRERHVALAVRSPLDAKRLSRMSTLRSLDLLACLPETIAQLDRLEHLVSLACECTAHHTEAIVAEVGKLRRIESFFVRANGSSTLGGEWQSRLDLTPLLALPKLHTLGVKSLGDPRLLLPLSPKLSTLDIDGMASHPDDWAKLTRVPNLVSLRLCVGELPKGKLSFAALRKLRSLALSVSYRSSLQVELPLSIENIEFAGLHCLSLGNGSELRALRNASFHRIDELPDLRAIVRSSLRVLTLKKVPYSAALVEVLDSARYQVGEVHWP